MSYKPDVIDWILIVICIILLGYAVYPSSASFTATEYIHSTGGVHINNDQTIQTGDNISRVWRPTDQYHEINAGQQIVTGPGNSEVDTNTVMTAGYEQNTNLKYSGGGAVWDTLYSGSIIPNVSEIVCTAGDIGTSSGSTPGSLPLDQWMNGQIGAQGPNGEYKSGKYAGGSDYALSGDFVGRGAYYGDLSAASGAGADKDSNEQNYAATMKRHVLGVSNMTGGVIASTDWTSDDPRNIFNISEAVNATADFSEEPNATANETDERNLTAVDEPDNQTGEEA